MEVKLEEELVEELLDLGWVLLYWIDGIQPVGFDREAAESTLTKVQDLVAKQSKERVRSANSTQPR